jgi:hypothetical protein
MEFCRNGLSSNNDLEVQNYSIIPFTATGWFKAALYGFEERLNMSVEREKEMYAH